MESLNFSQRGHRNLQQLSRRERIAFESVGSSKVNFGIGGQRKIGGGGGQDTRGGSARGKIFHYAAGDDLIRGIHENVHANADTGKVRGKINSRIHHDGRWPDDAASDDVGNGSVTGEQQTQAYQVVDVSHRVEFRGNHAAEQPIHDGLHFLAVEDGNQRPVWKTAEIGKIQRPADLDEAFGPIQADSRKLGGKIGIEASRNLQDILDFLRGNAWNVRMIVPVVDEVSDGDDLRGELAGNLPGLSSQLGEVQV